MFVVFHTLTNCLPTIISLDVSIEREKKYFFTNKHFNTIRIDGFSEDPCTSLKLNEWENRNYIDIYIQLCHYFIKLHDIFISVNSNINEN